MIMLKMAFKLKMAVVTVGLATLASSQAHAGVPIAGGQVLSNVILRVINGVHDWVTEHKGDVLAVVAVETGGHKYGQNKDADYGAIWASASTSLDNLSGNPTARAFAIRSGWMYQPVHANVKGLHYDGDAHLSEAESFASNHEIDVYTLDAPGLAQNTPALSNANVDDQNPDFGTVNSPLPGVEDDVWLTLAIPTDQFFLQARNGDGSGAVDWEYSVYTNGIENFYTHISLLGNGVFSVQNHEGVAGIGINNLINTLDEDGNYNLTLSANWGDGQTGYFISNVLIDHLDGNAKNSLLASSNISAEFDLTANSNLVAVASVASVPEPEVYLLTLLGLACVWINKRRRNQLQ